MNGNTIHRLKNIFSKPRSVIIAAIVLFLPLLFIGTHNSHDWGDDFAQYIHQAINIVKGIPQSETGYIYNPLNSGIGPQAYPMGFPLLLAPIYWLAGNSINAFISFISFLYIILGLLMVIFYRKYFSWITALVLTIIFLYNPQMVIFKREVMSDIPFTVLLVLNFILYQNSKSGNLKQIIILAFLGGFMLAIRPAGIVFVAAVVMDLFVSLYLRKIKTKDLAIRGGIFMLIPILVYYIINISIFKIPSGGSIHDYLVFYDSNNLLTVVSDNLQRYTNTITTMYLPGAGPFSGISLLLGSIILSLALLGFTKCLFRGPEALEWFLLFYMLMLLSYTYNKSPFRLMVPLGFSILYYAATGLKSIQLLPLIAVWKKTVAIGILIILLFLPGLIHISGLGNKTLEGPQEASAVEAFKYIHKNVSAEAIVMFAKPRALALYGGCHSIADLYTKDPTQLHVQVMNCKTSYILINNKFTNEMLLRYINVMQNRISKQFENKDFVLYKINPVNR